MSSSKITRPITGLGPAVPTHQASRADYVNTQETITPPLLPTSSKGQDIHNKPIESFAPMQNEPMAANGALGGGFGSAW
jgi:hypothetical protein